MLLLFSCGFLGPHFIDERANLGGGSFNLVNGAPCDSKSGPCERKISSLGVDFDAIEFDNAIQWLGTDNAMKSGAADGTLSISVEPLYSAPGERLNFCRFQCRRRSPPHSSRARPRLSRHQIRSLLHQTRRERTRYGTPQTYSKSSDQSCPLFSHLVGKGLCAISVRRTSAASTAN